MPTKRLDGSNPKSISQFDVIGIDGGITDFVTHIGLASETQDGVFAGTSVPLLHMQPPLAYSSEGSPAGVWGSAGLTVNEVRKIRLFTDELIGEYETQELIGRQQYCVIPKSEYDQSLDGTPVHRQFSCSTFVVEAYRRARIHFLNTARDQLPAVTLDTLKSVYDRLACLLDRQTFREQELNLKGSGPWPVVLPGYVLNALDRDFAQIRQYPAYRAAVGDEYFPSRRQ